MAYTVRLATMDDLPVIVHHRHAMFADMGDGTDESREAMRAPSEAWTREKMARGEYVGFLVQDEAGQVVGGAGLWLTEPIPGIDPTYRDAHLLNVYVEPHVRRQGIARQLVNEAVRWSRENGFSAITLHASDVARSLYASMGFRASNEMRFEIDMSDEKSEG